MEFLRNFIDFVIHVDVHLNELIALYGTWTYAILFAIIFSETGFVVTPFLPGDSLLFAAGALAAAGSLSSTSLFFSLSVAAILGNMTNYWIGYLVGPKILSNRDVRFINRRHLDRAHKFFEKYGGITIIYARFLPILRTFAPFVAGIGFMNYGKFMFFNATAGICWVGIFIYSGFFFGRLQVVRENFSVVLVAPGVLHGMYRYL